MRKRLCLITAAALTVGGIGFGSNASAQDAGRDQPGETVPPGDTPRGGATTRQQQQDREQTQEISSVIARVADAALSEGGMTRINAYIIEEDRDRLINLDQQDPQLRQSVQRLREVWKQKYKTEFNIGAQQLALDEQNSRIITGDPTDAARQAGQRIGPGESGGTGATGGTSGSDATGGTGGTGGTTGGGGVADSSGGTAATGGTGATTPGAGGAGGAAAGEQQVMLLLPETTQSPGARPVIVRLVRPAGADTTWNIDVPDTVDAQRFQQNLGQQIDQLAQQPDKLPGSEDEGYVVVARHVLIALTDAQADGQGQHPGGMRGDQDRPGDDPRPGEQPQQPGLSGGMPR